MEQNKITIYTIVYNDYGKYLPQWLENVKKTKANILVMLGTNHNANLDVLDVPFIIADKGLHNIALDNITTEYAMFFDVDDVLMENAVNEILEKNTDVVALKYLERYKGNETIKNSAIMTKGNFESWKTISTPGYYAFRRILNGDIMYFDNVSVPKFPHLFKLANRGATMTHTDNVCAIYNREKEHRLEDIQSRTKMIEERLKYYE